MRTKLTLRLDESLIQRAKIYSRQSGKPISQLVADYFALLFVQPDKQDGPPLPPVTSSLKGVLRGTAVDEKDYGKYLKEKYK